MPLMPPDPRGQTPQQFPAQLIPRNMQELNALLWWREQQFRNQGVQPFGPGMLQWGGDRLREAPQGLLQNASDDNVIRPNVPAWQGLLDPNRVQDIGKNLAQNPLGPGAMAPGGAGNVSPFTGVTIGPSQWKPPALPPGTKIDPQTGRPLATPVAMPPDVAAKLAAARAARAAGGPSAKDSAQTDYVMPGRPDAAALRAITAGARAKSKAYKAGKDALNPAAFGKYAGKVNPNMSAKEIDAQLAGNARALGEMSIKQKAQAFTNKWGAHTFKAGMDPVKAGMAIKAMTDAGLSDQMIKFNLAILKQKGEL